ncbi:MAG TPA: Fic family protein [Candidatus Nanoarchaeia archaeon]|nr:Fic family protein [Candidatus Nanoarchaeia archaeon]
MVFVSAKAIKGKNRYYLEKSIRLLDGRVKKFSVYLKGYSSKKKYSIEIYKKLLDAKISKELAQYAAAFYSKSNIFDEEMIKRMEEIKLGYNQITKKITNKQLQDIIDRFTVNFTYESNAIEGNSLTLKDVTLILHEKKAVKVKDLREIYETLNTRKAMELVFSNKLRINREDIIGLHKILVKDTGVSSGYKKLPNFILGRNVKTAKPENVEKEMSDLMDWYHKNKEMHPLQRASIFHGKFEKIHPFEDGNGRVGRLLINIMLLNHDYPPLIIRKTQRLAYFGCLEAFDKGHPDKLNRFLVEKYKKTYEKFFKVYVQYI